MRVKYLPIILIALLANACNKKSGDNIVVPQKDSVAAPAPISPLPPYPRNDIYVGTLNASFAVNDGCSWRNFRDSVGSFAFYATYENPDSIIFWGPDQVQFSIDGNEVSYSIAGAAAVHPGNDYTLGEYNFRFAKDSLYIRWADVAGSREGGWSSGQFAGRIINAR
jgi:hypothetical protein